MFPYMPIAAMQTLEFILYDLLEFIHQGNFKVILKHGYPSHSCHESFFKSDLKNSSLCRQLNGRKIMFYEAYHESGKIELNKRLYSDYAWVPVPHLYKYLTKERWEIYRPILSVY